jgi:1,4-dihydroxy-2-naphthoate polyprenyltransferase
MKETPSLMQAWMQAIRLRTLSIPTIQVLTGVCLAYTVVGTIKWPLLLYTWLVAVLITIGTNLINDVIDFKKGADKSTRVGFLKVISAGLISKEHIEIAGMTCFILAVLFSVPLAFHSGWLLFLLVLISVTCGYCYTGGPYPISYLGLSELFILVFYGGLCVGAAYDMQADSLSAAAFLCAMQMGLLAILPNALNNFRDMQDDAEDGKLTLAVRFGKGFARWEIALLTFLPFLLGIGWILLGRAEAALIPMFLIPLAFFFVRNVWIADPGPLFNRFFALSVLVHLLFGLLLIIGFFLSR